MVSKEDIKFLEESFSEFYEIGATAYGGVTRLGYSHEEDEMHRIFKTLGEREGFKSYCDEVGNTFVTNEIYNLNI